MISLLRHGATAFIALGQRRTKPEKSDFSMFVSPLARAQQAAKPVAAELGCAWFTLDPRLTQVNKGTWDCMPDRM